MIRTRLQIGDKDYAIVTDIPISTNYVQADIREPDKRNATFTKTITLYGNNDINILFENIFEANVVTQTFNPNKKVQAKYYVDELETLSGDLQLKNIALKPDNSIVYSCTILGNEGNLFVDIGEAYLDELDFSAYNHTYNRANQIASWSSAGTGSGYYYGFMHRGKNGGSDTVFSVTDFLPQFYAREYLQKIFSLHGYTWTSSFLDSNEFKHYVVEPNISTIPLSTSQLNNMQSYLGLNSNVAINYNGVQETPNFNNTSAPFFDSGQNFGTYLQLNNGGYFNLVSYTKVKFRFSHTAHVKEVAFSFMYLKTEILKSSDGGVTWFSLGNGYTNRPAGALTRLQVNTDYYFDVAFATGSLLFTNGDRFAVKVYSGLNNPTYYDFSGNPVTGGTATITYELESGATGTSFYALVTEKTVVENSTIYANAALPKKIKQKDFVKSIMQYANLFIDFDKNNHKHLIIEPYNEYFDDGIVNWENKIDLNKEIIVNPISMLDSKSYIYKYKHDTDWYNEKYLSAYSEDFGTEQINIDNDFVKSVKTNELIFSPTPLVANYSLGIAMPKLFKDNPNVAITPATPNIRLLYAGGVKNALNNYTYKNNGYTDLITNEYGYVGHIDDAQNPTIDLNFGLPKEVYYNFVNAQFTTNNAYNRFHRNYLLNNNSRDSKIMIAYLWLSPSDISTFSFRKKYFIKDSYYLVNKIVDYNPMVIDSTQVELIKVLNVDLFVPQNNYFRLSNSISSGKDVTIQSDNTSTTLGNSIVNSDTSLVVGNNNSTQRQSSNIVLVGNNITVPDTVSNFTLLNENVMANMSGNYSSVITVTSDYNVNKYDSLILVDASASNTQILLDNILDNLLTNVTYDLNGTTINYNVGKIITIKKIDASPNTVDINANGNQIDTLPIYTITTQFESITIQYDGTNWNVI